MAMEGESVDEAWIRERAGPQDSGTAYPPRRICLPITTCDGFRLISKAYCCWVLACLSPTPEDTYSKFHGSTACLG